MEGEICAVFGIRVACWGIGWECGMYISFPLLLYYALLTRLFVDGYGPQVPHQGLSDPDALLWNREYCG